MSVESLQILIEEINSLKTERLLKQRTKIKQQEWFFNFKGKLPSNWLEVNFMDVTWLITCGVAKKPDYVDDGIPFLSAQNTRPFKTNLNKIKYITQEAFDKLTVGGKPEKNDVLYTRVGNCGEAASIPYDFDFGVYVSLTLIKPIHELINHKFLVAFLNSNYGKIQANVGAIGIGLKNLNVENVRKYRIPLPLLPEQRAIVAKIEALFSDLDKGIADLKKAQDQLKVYRQAVLKKAFEGELTKEWREQQSDLPTADELLQQIKEERQKHYEQQIENWKQAVKAWEENGKEGKKPGKPKSLKQFEISEDVKNDLPDSYNVYSWISLGNLLIESPQNGLYEPASKYGSGTSIIRIDNFYDGVILKEEGFKRVQLSEEDIQKYSINENEILINRVNSIEYLGKCGLVKQLDERTVFESNIMRLQLLNTLINSNYITLFLSSVLGEKEIRRFAKHAVNQASINQTDVSITPIPICSLKEQHQIVQEIESRLSVCEKVEESIAESLEKAKALRQSILKKAFEGRLLSKAEVSACKAAPDYEPASVLLARIEQSRNEKIKAEKKR